MVTCGHRARGAKHHARKLVPSSAEPSTTALCHTRRGAAAQRLAEPGAAPTLWHHSQGVPTAGDTDTLLHIPGPLQGTGAAPCPARLRDPGEALPGPASRRHHQEMSQGWCRSEQGEEAKA